MTTGRSNQAQRYIRTIQRAMSKLEELIRENEAHLPEPRPQDPRSELLEQIHLAGAMEQRGLFRLLDQRSINHTWIGSQVASEYLDTWQAADGRTFYRVTPRAVKDLLLGQLASVATYASLSDAAFSDDWRSEEDSAYDRL